MLDLGAINAGKFMISKTQFKVRELIKEIESIVKFSIEMKNLEYEQTIDKDI